MWIKIFKFYFLILLFANFNSQSRFDVKKVWEIMELNIDDVQNIEFLFDINNFLFILVHPNPDHENIPTYIQYFTNIVDHFFQSSKYKIFSDIDEKLQNIPVTKLLFENMQILVNILEDSDLLSPKEYNLDDRNSYFFIYKKESKKFLYTDLNIFNCTPLYKLIDTTLNIQKVNELNFTDLKTFEFVKNSNSKLHLFFIGDLDKYFSELKVFIKTSLDLKINSIYYLHAKDAYSKVYDFFNIDNTRFDIIMLKIPKSKKIEELNFTKDDFKKLNISIHDFNVITHFETLIKKFTNNVVIEYNNEIYENVISGYPTFIFLHNPITDLNDIKTSLKKLAKKYFKMTFTIADNNSEFFKNFVNSFSLKTDQFATVCITQLNKEEGEIEKFKFDFDKTIPTFDELNKILSNWELNKLERYFVSEDLTSDTSNTINKLNRKSLLELFDKRVESNLILFVCAERYELCGKSKDIFITISKKLKDTNIFFAEINPYLNELNFLKFDYLPSFLFFSNKNNKLYLTEYKQYKGEVSVHNIVDYIKKNVHYKIKEYLVEDEDKHEVLSQIDLRDEDIEDIDDDLEDMELDMDDYDGDLDFINYLNEDL